MDVNKFAFNVAHCRVITTLGPRDEEEEKIVNISLASTHNLHSKAKAVIFMSKMKFITSTLDYTQ